MCVVCSVFIFEPHARLEKHTNVVNNINDGSLIEFYEENIKNETLYKRDTSMNWKLCS